MFVEAEVWSEKAVHGVQVRWLIDGVLVASDRLAGLGPEMQRVAMILEPARMQHRVDVAIWVDGAKASDSLVLPPLCPSLLQLANFQWDSKGLQVRLFNLGPGSSGRVGLRWTINGMLYSKQSLDPLPAGTSAELHLPATAHPLLERALGGEAGERRGRSRLTPVVVSLEATPGPQDLETPTKSWQFFLGYVRVHPAGNKL